MRVWTVPKPAGIDSLVLREQPTPHPGPGQVLVRMRAASLNYRDLMVVTGTLCARRSAARPGAAIGWRGRGGRGRPGRHAGEAGRSCRRHFMQTWIGGDIEPEHAASSLGGAIHGVLAEYVVFSQDGLVHLPEHLSFEEGATLPCAGVTAWNALYGGRPPIAGQSVLVLGTGGVSIFALQLAHAAGARVITTSSSDGKLAQAKTLGASDGVNYREHPEWHKDVLQLTGGRGVDHVVEIGGAGTLPSFHRVGAARRPGAPDRRAGRRRGRHRSVRGDAQRPDPARHLCRLTADVRGDEPCDRTASDQPGDRSRVRLRGSARMRTGIWRARRMSGRW